MSLEGPKLEKVGEIGFTYVQSRFKEMGSVGLAQEIRLLQSPSRPGGCKRKDRHVDRGANES